MVVGVVTAGEVWFCVRFEVLGEVVLSEGELSAGEELSENLRWKYLHCQQSHPI